MDPLTGAITGAVIFAILAVLLFAPIVWVVVAIGATLFDEVGALFGAIIGYLLAAGWFIFAAVKVIAFIVQAVGLA